MKSQVEEYRQYVKSQISNDLSETISSLKNHQRELLDLFSQLNEAKTQVTKSSTEAQNEIKDTFDQILKVTINEIEERKTSLLHQVKKAEEEALVPLEKCESLLQERLKEAKKRLEQGECFQKGTITVSKDAVAHFQDDAASMTILPEVPPLCTVPYISIRFPENPDVPEVVRETIRSCGSLSRIGPVQITTVEERPGGLLVNWEEVEDDEAICHEFKLEYRPQTASSPDSFVRVYEGKDFSFLLRDVAPHREYLLRVASRQEGERVWSQWSLPVRAVTYIAAFCWAESSLKNSCWSLADGARLATKGGPGDTNAGILFSDGPQLFPGSSLLIEIVCSRPTHSDEEGVGLCWEPLPDGIPTRPGTLFLSAQGVISQDGVKRLTKLPPMRSGAKVIISNETISSTKVRISIELSEKEVAYDWTIPRNANGRLHFFVNFHLPGWIVSLH